MSKHTPGPWQFIRENGENKIFAPPADHLRTHETLMCDTQYYPWCPANDADWRLIAAAPELLAAAQAAWNCISELSATQARVEVAHMLDDAIAKATGDQA